MSISRARRKAGSVFIGLVVLFSAVPTVVLAAMSASTSQTNTFGAGTLYAPGAVTTQHVEGVNNDGSVTLTWNETSGTGTLSPPSYQILPRRGGALPDFQHGGHTRRR